MTFTFDRILGPVELLAGWEGETFDFHLKWLRDQLNFMQGGRNETFTFNSIGAGDFHFWQCFGDQLNIVQGWRLSLWMQSWLAWTQDFLHIVSSKIPLDWLYVSKEIIQNSSLSQWLRSQGGNSSYYLSLGRQHLCKTHGGWINNERQIIQQKPEAWACGKPIWDIICFPQCWGLRAITWENIGYQ